MTSFPPTYSDELFEATYYLANNPDVAAAVADGVIASGLDHFRRFGQREGRTAISALYNETLYLTANPDVAPAIIAGGFASGLDHYILRGQFEGRVGRWGLFNEAVYLKANPDVADAVATASIGSAFEHYQGFVADAGATERRPGTRFNADYYLAKYEDVAIAFAADDVVSPLDHFINNGLAEGRIGGVDFDEGFYLKTNPDVAAAVQLGAVRSGLIHYALAGEAEGRSATAFNEAGYRVLNGDRPGFLDALNQYDSGTLHYDDIGRLDFELTSVFSGTSDRNAVKATGFGDKRIYGVEVTFDVISGEAITGNNSSIFGDTLIGSGPGNNTFVLGDVNSGVSFYETPELANESIPWPDDYATVRGFTATSQLELAGSAEDYVQQVIDGSLVIYYTGTSSTQLDAIAVLDGWAIPLDTALSQANGFTWSFVPLAETNL